MKNLTTLFLFLSFGSFGQIQDLKDAQDARIKLFKAPKTEYFSKSLYVNPFIGTGGHGHTYPGASIPFGMMQLSPDTRPEGWDGCSGYHYSDSVIYGFSHTHLSGTGVPDYCDLLIMPQSGVPAVDPGYKRENGFGSKFSHDKESASPGYYKVHLDDDNIDVQLTVAERSGMHEYTFNDQDGKRFILIDLDHRDKVLDAAFNIIDKQRISGKRISSAWAREQHFYFYIEIDQPYQKVRKITKDGRNKLLLIFPKEVKKVTMKVGISAVDEEGAENNLTQELPNWDFNEIRAKVTRKWNAELDKISFLSADKEIMTNFYTGLYHSFLNPNVFNDVDGRYRGRDNAIHVLDKNEGNNYTVFSLWDTYRATHPLFTITQIGRTNAFIRTFLRQYEQGGDLPVWELAGNETECMIGYHSVSVIADAYMKGIRDYDAAAILLAMQASSNFDEYGKSSFKKEGFIGVGDEPESVSKTLEYAYDEFCVAQMMAAMNNENDQDLLKDYQNTSLQFINTFDPETKFMRGRNGGLWFSPFDPAEVNFNYTEANSWQYSLYAPHAVGILTELLGGKDSLEAWLDRLFTTESNLSGRHQVDITGLIGQYAHGNEPSHHIAYLYNYTNHPEKTQYYVDRIQKEMYHNAPDGLSGNEDCGQMSSWYVLSAMGLYQIAPGNPNYEIGRPLMKQAEIALPEGSSFVITTVNNKAENPYVKKAILNGQVLNRLYITHDEIMAGGELILEMTATPFAYSHISAPTINEIPETFVALPYFKNATRVFEGEQTIELACVTPESKIYYMIGGSLHDKIWTEYTKPINIDKNTTISMRSQRGAARSTIVSNTFIKKRTDIHINIHGEYDNQYAASGEFTLIDGIRGGDEYRTGDWQGYWDQEVEFEIHFDDVVHLDSIGIGVLRDMKSWIFYPKQVIFMIGYHDDLEVITKQVVDLPNPTTDDQFPQHQTISVDADESRPLGTLKIKLIPYEKCPEWHLGAGNPTWLFVDEINFKER